MNTEEVESIRKIVVAELAKNEKRGSTSHNK
jgi:hypothetical protein